ncbi:MAG: NADH-quinone oxidoreductase subunit J [Desulfuromonas sp.]|nr:MAG: NADH-quinone oxidoreductase subunit J [Desulfuromonas sp.]
MEQLLFFLVASIAVIAGFLVVKCKSPVNSAMALVQTFVCLAALYVMLYAPFMAAIQIMVYAGAIMVLIIFVIMLLNLGTAAEGQVRRGVIWGGLSGILMLMITYLAVTKGKATEVVGSMTNEVIMAEGHTKLIGKAIFTDFLLPFEIASILLLVAIIGAVVLAKRDV